MREAIALVFGSISEKEILRDLLFAFQGIDGKYVSYSILDDSYTVSASARCGLSRF